MYYDRAGREIGIEEWIKCFSEEDYILDRDRFIHDRQWVSVYTSWLGIDHNFTSHGIPPLIYETIVMGGTFDGFVDRYATEADARAGHQEVLQMVGYRQKGPRRKKWFRKLELELKGLYGVVLIPSSVRVAWINTLLWAFCFVNAVISVAANIALGKAWDLWPFWVMVLCGVLGIVMFQGSLRGLLHARREAKEASHE